MAFNRFSCDGFERGFLESQLHPFHGKQLLILPDDGILRFFQNPHKLSFGECLHLCQHGNTPDKLRNQAETDQVFRLNFREQPLAFRTGLPFGIDKADRLCAQTTFDFIIQTYERSPANEEDIGSVQPDVFCLRMLTASLFGHVGNGAFNNLQQRLLHPFSADITRDGGVFCLAGNLIDFVDIDNAALGLTDIHPAVLQEVEQNVFNVFTHVSGLGNRGGIGNCKGNIEQLCQRFGEKGLAASGRPNQQHITLFNLNIGKGVVLNGPLLQSFVVIMHGHRKCLFHALLTDDILIEKGFYLRGHRNIQLGQRFILLRFIFQSRPVHFRQKVHHLMVFREFLHHTVRQRFRATVANHRLFLYPAHATLRIGLAPTEETRQFLIMVVASHKPSPLD